MRFKPNALLVAVAGAAALLAGCGGGGGTAETSAPAMTNVPVTVIDGAIKNALVCLDKNLSGTCDSDEPSGRTDASGNITLQVAAADAGRYPIVAQVGTDAEDVDHGPVSVAFVMKTPADKPSVVSPLTTLVQTTVETSGGTSAEAEAAIQSQMGVNVSLFQDFTRGDTRDENLGTIARMVVVTTQEQTTVLSGAIGGQAIDGSVITQADINKVISRKLLEVLPTVVAAAADPRVTSASDADKDSVLKTVAGELVADPNTGLTTASVATLVGIANLTDSGAAPAETPTARFTLHTLKFIDVQNWFARVLSASAAQATPDSSSNMRFVDRRSRSASAGSTSAIANWNAGADPHRQADLHWNGSGWVGCGLNHENVSSVRDAQGRSAYDYCDKIEQGVSTQAAFDIAGRTMLDVYNEAVNAGFTNLSIASTSALGAATFPAGSKLFYHTNTPMSQAPANYYPGPGNFVTVATAAVAAGKTSPTDTTSACASITSSTPVSSYQSDAATLEDVVARNPGAPCVFTANSSTGPRNESWGLTSASLGVIGNAPLGGSAFYTTNTPLRVAFGANNATTYLSCQQRASDGSNRNCNPIGTGTYTITPLGDGRIMTFNNLPTQAAALNSQRVFVQRGGKVFFGFQGRLTPTRSARLNITAGNALFSQLGLPTVDPEVPLALTQASYQGDWVVGPAGNTDPANTSTIRLSGSGAAAACFTNDTTPPTPDTCTVTLTPGSGAITAVFTDGNFAGTMNFVAGTISGTFTPNDPAEAPMSITGLRR